MLAVGLGNNKAIGLSLEAEEEEVAADTTPDPRSSLIHWPVLQSCRKMSKSVRKLYPREEGKEEDGFFWLCACEEFRGEDGWETQCRKGMVARWVSGWRGF